MVYNELKKRGFTLEKQPRPDVRRFVATAVVTVVALLACSSAPALAGEREDRRAERMALRLEEVFTSLAGSIESGRLRFRAHGNGIHSVGYPLDRVERARFGLRGARAGARAADKSLRVLANGHMLTEPLVAGPSALINALVADNTALYNFWWATVNLGDEELVRKTVIQITGPDDYELEVEEEEFPYGPASLWVFWFTPEEPLGGEGIYTHRVWVQKAGKSIYQFIAETPPPPEDDEEGEAGEEGEDEGDGEGGSPS